MPEVDMPENVRKLLEANPELLRNLADPAFIERINKNILDAATASSDWCVACGASAARAPDFTTVTEPLTTAEIQTIGRRLLQSR